MNKRRRTFLKLSSSLLTSGFLVGHTPTNAQARQKTPLPDPATFKNGDFVWPKKPGAYVPYYSPPPGAALRPEQDEIQWLKERDQFLRSLQSHRTHLTSTDLRQLNAQDFKRFRALYFGDRPPYVGHVGIIEVDSSGISWVVEALKGRGVVRQTYDDWLASRPKEIVWHGRLKNMDAGQQSKIVAECRKHVGQPYNFWNFDLNDATDFYCSKLVWLSVYRSLGFAVDGEDDPKRRFWFSPKQLLNAARVNRLHNPAEY